MPRAKHDYDALYNEFLKSDNVDVTPFLVEKNILKKGKGRETLSASINGHFKGWREKKEKQLSMANAKAKTIVVKSKIDEWVKVYKNVDVAERKALYEIASTIMNGMPVYAMKKVCEKNVIDRGQGSNGVVGHRPLTFVELKSVWETLRLAQGKASDITLNLVMGLNETNKTDPIGDKLREMDIWEAERKARKKKK